MTERKTESPESGGHSFALSWLTAPSHITASRGPVSMSLWEEITLIGSHSMLSWHARSLSAFPGVCLALWKLVLEVPHSVRHGGDQHPHLPTCRPQRMGGHSNSNKDLTESHTQIARRLQ